MRVSILLTIALLLSLTVSNAQRRKSIPPEKPKLIVGIVVENMRYDFLHRYWDNFGENGFKKLVNEGTLCRNAHYQYSFTQTAPGMATLVSGTEPEVHGIVANQWYHQLKGESVFATDDPKTTVVGPGNEKWKCSPKQLLTTTFTDELKLFNNNYSKVISISLDAPTSILGGGHMANAAYWFDETTGNFISSSYYLDSLPGWVTAFNNKKFPDIYLEQSWLPSLSIEKYRAGSVQGLSKNVGFDSDNKFSKKISSVLKKQEQYTSLLVRPQGNTLTKDFAVSAIFDESLGKDQYSDYLSLTFTVPGRIAEVCGARAVELEDLYLKLDADIAHFISFLEDQFGKHEVLVFLTADHGIANDPEVLAKANIPSGRFNSDRAIMLLRTYLNAVYGKGKWITMYNNRQIYLNRQLIEDADLKPSEVQNVVAKFMIQFSGVANAITASQLESTNYTSGIFAKMQNSYNQKRSGDVMLNLEPGWIEDGQHQAEANSGNRHDTHVPLIWYGWKIKRSQNATDINITDIAPTIANFLSIPYPNGCSGKVIDDLVK